MYAAKDSDGEETVSANHFSSPRLPAKAHFCVNYGNAVIDSILEEEDVSEDHGVSTSQSGNLLFKRICLHHHAKVK